MSAIVAAAQNVGIIVQLPGIPTPLCIYGDLYMLKTTDNFACCVSLVKIQLSLLSGLQRNVNWQKYTY